LVCHDERSEASAFDFAWFVMTRAARHLLLTFLGLS